MSHRVFFALWPDEGAGESMARLARDCALELGGRATPREKLHLTLAFIAHASDDDVEALHALGAETAPEARSFDLDVDRLSAFPGTGIVWAGTRAEAAALTRLVALLRAGLGRRGLPVEQRRYTPHVTLARRASKPLRDRGIEAIACRFDTLTLVESQLAPTGSRYEVLARWPLKGDDGR